jgi:hypothetical protein
MTDRSLDVRMSEDGALLAFKITGDPHIPWVIVTVDEDGMYTTYTRVTAPSGTRSVRLVGTSSTPDMAERIRNREDHQLASALGFRYVRPDTADDPHTAQAYGTRVTRLDAEGKPTGETWTP